jgi:hypothetical protein
MQSDRDKREATKMSKRTDKLAEERPEIPVIRNALDQCIPEMQRVAELKVERFSNAAIADILAREMGISVDALQVRKMWAEVKKILRSAVQGVSAA